MSRPSVASRRPWASTVTREKERGEEDEHLHQGSEEQSLLAWGCGRRRQRRRTCTVPARDLARACTVPVFVVVVIVVVVVAGAAVVVVVVVIVVVAVGVVVAAGVVVVVVVVVSVGTYVCIYG